MEVSAYLSGDDGLIMSQRRPMVLSWEDGLIVRFGTGRRGEFRCLRRGVATQVVLERDGEVVMRMVFREPEPIGWVEEVFGSFVTTITSDGP